jgi:hypothetical protein
MCGLLHIFEGRRHVVQVYETRDGVTKPIYPTSGESVKHSDLSFTHTVTIKVKKEALFVVPFSDKFLPLVWDTVALEYIAYIPVETNDEAVTDLIIKMFSDWQCDIKVQILWVN